MSKIKNGKNKTVLFTIIGIIIGALLIVGIIWFLTVRLYVGGGNLKVTVSDWTGWSEQQPNDKEYDFKISDKLIFEVPSQLGNKSFKVNYINSNDIVITLPSGVIQENEKGGIDLEDNTKQTITVKTNGDEVKAITQTMDAGTTYTFKYLK